MVERQGQTSHHTRVVVRSLKHETAQSEQLTFEGETSEPNRTDQTVSNKLLALLFYFAETEKRCRWSYLRLFASYMHAYATRLPTRSKSPEISIKITVNLIGLNLIDPNQIDVNHITQAARLGSGRCSCPPPHACSLLPRAHSAASRTRGSSQRRGGRAARLPPSRACAPRP